MIPFPKMHIADSVINRVLNTLDGEQKTLGLIVPEPQIPDTKVSGAEIDAAVNRPAPPVALPPSQEANGNAGLVESSVLGGSPFDGAMIGSGV